MIKRIAALLPILVALLYVSGFYQPKYVWDLGIFLDSGQAFLQGENPYRLDSGQRYMEAHHVFGSDGVAPNLTPPLLLPLFGLLSHLSPHAAYTVWFVAAAATYALAYAIIYRENKPDSWTLFLALNSAGMIHGIIAGQVYAFLALGTVVTLLLLKREESEKAGVIIGIMCVIKPHLLMWPLFLLLSKERRAGIFAFVTVGAVTLLSLLVFGYEVHASWLHVLATKASATRYTASVSLHSLLETFAPRKLHFILTALICLMSIGCAAWDRRAHRVSEYALTLAVLVAPISWVGYTSIVVAAMLMNGRRSALFKFGLLFFMVPIHLLIYLPEYPLAYAVYPVGLLLLYAEQLRDVLHEKRVVSSAPPITSSF